MSDYLNNSIDYYRLNLQELNEKADKVNMIEHLRGQIFRSSTVYLKANEFSQIYPLKLSNKMRKRILDRLAQEITNVVEGN